MSKFYPKVILLYGAAIAGITTGLFLMFYYSGWVFSHSLSGMVLWIAKIFFVFLITLLAISRLRKAAGSTNFMMVAVHVLLLSVVAAGLGSAYNSYFFNEVDPQYEVKLYQTAIKAKNYQLAYYEQERDTPERLLVDLQKQVEQAKQNIEIAKTRSHSFIDEFRIEVSMYLFTGLINALILGLFFGILLKDAPSDTSEEAKVLYKRDEEE